MATSLPVILPAKLGAIGDAEWFEFSPYLIFKIQDASFGIDVREGTVDLLRHLHERHGLTLVCVEGGADESLIPATKAVLKPHDLPWLKNEFEAGRLSGPEYLALTSDIPLIIHGVEDARQYVKNIDALNQAHQYESRIEGGFKELERRVDEMKTHVYDQRLLEFDRALAEHRAGTIGLTDFVTNWLGAYANQLELPLDGSPTISILLRLAELERATRPGEVAKERGRLINDIQVTLGAPRVDRGLLHRVVRAGRKLRGAAVTDVSKLPQRLLVDEYRLAVGDIMRSLARVGLGTRLEMHPVSAADGDLIDLASLLGLEIRHYPNFLTNAHYAHLHGRLPTNALSAELADAIEMIEERLFTDQRERDVATAARAVSSVWKLCRLEVSSADGDRFLSEFGRLVLDDLLRLVLIAGGDLPPDDDLLRAFDRSARGGAAGHDEEGAGASERETAERVDAALAGAYRFYKLAPLRARSIAKNTLRLMQEHDVTVAAVIAGGFLTEQIVDVLQRENISYMVIMPRGAPSAITREEYLGKFRKSP
jgi:hypothetical protein